MAAINSVGNALTGSTGSGLFVGATSPTLVTPLLGTPTSGNLVNTTGYPVASLANLGTGVATALAANVNGSGAISLTTSPALVTPSLGVATATSITFGGSTLSTYNIGTWTPIDASGASLSFTSASGVYTQIGNMVIASCTFTYPSTANGSPAIVGGLPVVTGSTNEKMGGTVVKTTVATLAHATTLKTNTAFSLFTTAGAGVLNSAMSLSTNTFQLIYFI